MQKYSVLLNGILIPAVSVESTLSRYTEPLAVWNHDDIYSCSLIGSSTAIRYRSRYLLLCTRHQLKVLDGRSFTDVGLLDKDGDRFCSAGGIRYFEDENATDYHDLVAFDFTEPCKERPLMRERFFNFIDRPFDLPSDNIVAFVVSGFPSKDQKYELEEKHLGFTKRIVVCSPADEQLGDPSLISLKPEQRLDFDCDGMSGGAAFVIQLNDGKQSAHLAGIISRGGPDNFHIIKIGYILRFIDGWLSSA